MADDDLLSALTSGKSQSAAQVQAIVSQLRSRGNLGALAAMSGDPALAPFGQHVMQQDQQDQVELGRNAMQNRSDDIRQEQYERALAQGQGTLAESVRYHNMLDQERKDKLDQQKELKEQQNSPEFQSTVNAILRYNSPLPSNRSARNGALIDAVYSQDPTYDSTKFDEKKKAQVSFGSGPDSNLVKSADVSIQHLDTADRLAANLHNTKYPLVNSVSNFFSTQLGGKEVGAFNTAKDIVSDEVNKFIIGGGGALADREGLQAKLQAATGPEALREVTNTLRTLMGGQVSGLQSKFVNAGLGTEQDFLKRLKPQTISALGLAAQQEPPPGGALPGAVAAASGPPGMGSGPPAGPAPGAQGAAPAAGLSGAPGAAPGAISPAEAQLRSSTGALSNGMPAPQTAVVDNKGIVRTGRRAGKKVGQLADGTIVPLE